jgi:hypothetical protein
MKVLIKAFKSSIRLPPVANVIKINSLDTKRDRSLSMNFFSGRVQDKLWPSLLTRRQHKYHEYIHKFSVLS